MGKFHGLVSSLNNKANLDSPKHDPSASPLASHVQSKHAASLVSPCGKPARYTDEDDQEKLVMPSAVAGRLQTPTPAPGLQAEASQQQLARSSAPMPESNQQQYSRLAARMIGMVNELRASGADVALELPTIVVCGQQSAGKSSVVEAICGVPLPRNQETCTRCPTEVRLTQQQPANGTLWEATVKLRRDHSSAAAAAAASFWSSAGPQLYQQQQHQHHQQQQQHGQGGSMYSPMSSGMVSACSSPAGSRQPSATLHSLSETVAAPSAPPAPGTPSTGGTGSSGLESVFRAGISNPADLPAAVQAAQAALLCQLPRGSATSGAPSADGAARRPGSSQSSFGRAAGTPAAAAEAAVSAAAPSGVKPGGGLEAAGAGGPVPLKFTRDVVVVEVRGAQVDLTLIDLPGIVQNVERPEDEHYKGLVTELVTSYMRRPGCVIIATITCKEDIDTQGILSMAREADPRGERTLGVLTKPDQVEEGCHGQWLQVLAGDRYPLALGWYVVRNPNQAALTRGTSAQAARQQEEAFFATAGPWNRLPSNSKARLGTLKLREAMSRQLVKLVSAARPALLAAAQQQLTALRVELAAMPPVAVLGDGHAELLRLIDDISNNIHEEVLARSQNKQFYQALLLNFQELKAALEGSRPCFLLPRGGGGSSGSGSAGYLAVTCALDGDLAGADDSRTLQVVLGGGSATPQRNSEHNSSDGSKGTPTAGASGRGASLFEMFSSGSSSGKVSTGVVVSHPVTSPSHGAGCPAAQTAMVLAACPHQVLLPPDAPEARRGLTLEDVRQLVERHHSVELPGFSPYSAVQDLVGRHQKAWANAVADCATASHRQLMQLVLLHVSRTFGRFPRAADHIREIAAELLEELLSEASAALESLVAMEWAGAFAVGRREFSRASAQHLEGLKTLLAAGGNTWAAGGGGGSSSGAVAGVSEAGTAVGETVNRLNSLATQSSVARRRSQETGAAAGGAAVLAVGGVGPAAASGLYEPAASLAGLPATATGPAELLAMMSAVLTYYGISCRRLSDTVSLSVMHHLVNAFTNKFRARLASELLALSPAAVAALLVEDAASAARRAALTAQKEVLETAMKVIRAAV